MAVSIIFQTNFWYMWQTTFAFQPWHSAVELKRYLHRFINEFPRIETLGGVKRTVYNQYDAIVRPLMTWLEKQGVQFVRNTRVTDMGFAEDGGKISVKHLVLDQNGNNAIVLLDDDDLVFFQNGSMTDASSLGSMRQDGVRKVQLHSLPDAVHHKHVYATEQLRSATPGPLELQESCLCQPVC